jgi:hypothetical protein
MRASGRQTLVMERDPLIVMPNWLKLTAIRHQFDRLIDGAAQRDLKDVDQQPQGFDAVKTDGSRPPRPRDVPQHAGHGCKAPDACRPDIR